MKYIRKIAWLLITVIFLASVIIGFGVVFALKNVNVNLQSYTYTDGGDTQNNSSAAEETASLKGNLLGRLRGTLIFFIGDEEVRSCFDESGYVVAGWEKDYPCTINVTLKEKREVFCVRSGDGFNTYDSQGMLLRANAQDGYFNNVDGAPNIIIEPYLSTGTAYAISEADIVKTAKTAAAFGKAFGGLRSVAESITLNAVGGYIDFNLRCGMILRISDYTVLPEEKCSAAKTEFDSLTAEQKINGGKSRYIIVATTSSDGKVSAKYQPLLENSGN